MRSQTRFSRMHYEHMIRELRLMEVMPLVDRGVTKEELSGTIEVLCRIFKKDNPKFKREKFLRSIFSEEDTTCTP